MRSTFHGIETAKRSLFSQTAWMNTTGHNIANASTEGYSRQIVRLVASRPIEAPGFTKSGMPGQLGTGVEYESITRVRDTFLDQQYWNANRSLGEWEIQADTLSKLETIFNEPSESGLQTVINNFWTSWSDLSNDPENITARKIVRENALAMIDAFNETSKKIADLQGDLTRSIDVKSSTINTLSSQIASLNLEISRIEGFGDNANDLRDQRDLIIDELSKIVNVTVVEEDRGYTVTAAGIELVNGPDFATVSASDWESAYSGGSLTSGELFGIIKSRDVIVDDYSDQLDALVNTIANGEVTLTIPAGSVLPEGTVLNNITYTGTNRTLTADLTVTVKGINGLHQLGYSNTNPARAGQALFTSSDGGNITASTIQLNPNIESDPNLIASSMRVQTSTTGDTVVTGNNTLALLMSQLNELPFSFASITSNNGLTTGTIGDYYQSILGQLGVESSEATRQVSNNTLLVDQIDGQRQSVSGVSLDEEMSNLIKFQHAYSAAARFMTTMDENLDKVINGMGVVGR